jgi:aminopeptidase
MIDPRVVKTAQLLVNYSTRVKTGDRVAILSDVEAWPLIKEVYRECIKAGASEVRVHISSAELQEIYFKHASNRQIETFPQLEWEETKNMQVYIRIWAPSNTRSLTNVDSKKISARSKVTGKIMDRRVDHTKWVIVNYPTQALAQEADMSLSEYSDFVFSAMLDVDWNKVKKEQDKLKKLVTKTKMVRIVGPDTDLTFSIDGRAGESAWGDHNMPDGEVFTSVVENSTDGYITYSYPALYQGKEFHNVRLEFKNGKVVKAAADKGGNDLNKILDMDSGSRRIGELGIGNNFKIQKFTKDILFDEKIGGTIHIALGSGYTETGSKNKSGLHWDMVKDLRDGGELYFDGKLVQKNGKWVKGVV